MTNVGHDRSQLANMAEQAKAVLQTDKLEAVADRGYFEGKEILACEESGIAVTLPKPMTSNAKAEGRFGKQDFVYLAADDAYRCPAGERLTYRYTKRRRRKNAAPLLDHGLCGLPAKAAVHDRQGAPHHALGARARA